MDSTEYKNNTKQPTSAEEMENGFDSLLNVSAVPQDDRMAAFIAESRNNRNRCYELFEQATAEVATDGQAFQTYLDVQSRFDRYTANNALLIAAQMPDAEKLGDYGYWRDRGAFIKRSERNYPVLILEPGKEYEREDGGRGTYYNARKLYDISQTSMKEREEVPERADEKQLIRALVSNPPASIVPADADQLPEGKGAYFEPEENCIYVRKGMDAQEIFESLTPELVLAGFADGDKKYDRTEDTFYAYYASYVVCQKHGMDTQKFDFTHTPDFFEGLEPQEVRGELKKVRDASCAILSRMSKVLDQNRSQYQSHSRSQNRRQNWDDIQNRRQAQPEREAAR